jgi:hypothetical protein
MEPALARQALTGARGVRLGKGRRIAALLLFWGGALAGCHKAAAPVVAARYRVGLGAVSLSLSPDGSQLAVACRRSNDVWVLALPAGAALARVDTLPKPRAVMFHPQGGSFYVAEGLSSVAQVRLADRRVARHFRPRWRVTSMAWDPSSGRIFAGHLGIPLLGVYRLKDMHLATSVAVGGEVVQVAFGGGNAWILTRQADGLAQMSLRDMSVKAVALTGPDPRALCLDQGKAWVACHGRRGTAGDLALPTEAPSPEALSPLSASAQDDAAPDDGGPEPAGSAAQDAADDKEDLSPTAAVQDPSFEGGGVALFELADLRRVDYLAVPGGPVALAVAPSGRELAVACEDGRLRMLNIEARAVSAELDLGGRPSAMVPDPGGDGLLVALSNQKLVLRVRLPAPWR